MENAPRNPREKILSNDNIKVILFNGIVKGIVAYGAFLAMYFYNHHLASHYEKAVTVTFISIIFGNYANVLSTRTYGNALGKYFYSNRNLLFGFALSIISVVIIVYVPVFNLYFRTSPLLPGDWLFPIAAGVICLLIYEDRKKIEMK